ncbi:MAG: helix-turn-helix domain-containing protein [Nocardioidaceae bacterium]|nr:helix-turn-helix domain-containing protein [Nocardioidaceae bacterium]
MPRDADLLLEFGTRIRTARATAGLSQESLAEACGLHRTYIGSVERGERNVGLLNLLALATALHIDPAHLVEGLRRPAP